LRYRFAPLQADFNYYCEHLCTDPTGGAYRGEYDLNTSFYLSVFVSMTYTDLSTAMYNGTADTLATSHGSMKKNDVFSTVCNTDADQYAIGDNATLSSTSSRSTDVCRTGYDSSTLRDVANENASFHRTELNNGYFTFVTALVFDDTSGKYSALS
jgi:hypothetical protein